MATLDLLSGLQEAEIADLVDFRGKMRSDKYREEWVDIWCSDRCTRARDRSSDEINPNTKKGLEVVSTAFSREEDRHFSDIDCRLGLYAP